MDVHIEYFLFNYLLSVSNCLFVGINVDRAIGIKKPFTVAHGGTKTVLKKIVACWIPACLPPLPYLFDTAIEECRENTPEEWCFPPRENVGDVL